jgi:outer membrane cobalamin receptor
MKPKRLLTPVWILLVCLETLGYASTATVSTTVRDLNTHEEIQDVNIFVENTQIGTVTNIRGLFTLDIPDTVTSPVLVFRHIAYEEKHLSLESIQSGESVYLQPRIIPLEGIEVIGKGQRTVMDIRKDLPIAVTVLEAKPIETQGFTDAGDYLKTESSIQVEEELSGQKTISLRGGNPEDVVVLYNGVKLNNALDHTFDLSTIQLADLSHMEVIKGGQTTLYGPEAFSGVINIVPRFEHQYHLRAVVQSGTYSTENFGLQTAQKIGSVHASYGYHENQHKRYFAGHRTDQKSLTNHSRHHTLNLAMDLNHQPDQNPNRISVMGLFNSLDFDNRYDRETQTTENTLGSIRYQGALGSLSDWDLSVSYRQLSQDQAMTYTPVQLNREWDNDATVLKIQKGLALGPVSGFASYQFEHNHLDFHHQRTESDDENSQQMATVTRKQHGWAAVAKIDNDPASAFLKTFRLDLSFRHDRVHDSPSDSRVRYLRNDQWIEQDNPLPERQWNASTIKMATSLTGYRNDMVFTGYTSFGKNVKFPTLLQQFSSTLSITPEAYSRLSPERLDSYEMGVDISRELDVNDPVEGFEASIHYFKNYYENKFRSFYTPGIPILFYDTVPIAEISGIETSFTTFMFHKSVTLNAAFSQFSISEKEAFPFRSDQKLTGNITIHYRGYKLRLHAFSESEQIGWVQNSEGALSQVTLKEYNNIDLHFYKSIELWRTDFFLSISGRNLLPREDLLLRGLSLRDRRFYVTLGTQL